MFLFLVFGTFLLLAVFGVPLVYSLLITTVGYILLLGLGHPLETIFLTYIGGVEPFIMIAIPLFIMAGELLGQGGVGRRVVTFARTLFGWLPGGLGIVTVVSAMLFGGVSGSAIADTAAVGSVMIPAMTGAGYSRGFAASVVAAAGTLGIIIPPSIPMLVYGFVSGASVGDLFLSGVVPGLVFGLGMMAVCVLHAKKHGIDSGGKRASLAEIASAFRAALPALIMPGLIIGGILSGVFTPTESSAVAVVYGLFVSIVVYKDLSVRDIPRLVLNSFITSAVVMVVIGATAALGWLLTIEQAPQQLADMITAYATDKWVFLLILNIVVLILGHLLEPVPAMLLCVPLFLPIAKTFGVDPVHMGLLITCNLAIGMFTPPVGATLFVAAKMAKIGIGEVSRTLLPMFVVILGLLMLVTYVEVIPMGLVWLRQAP